MIRLTIIGLRIITITIIIITPTTILLLLLLLLLLLFLLCINLYVYILLLLSFFDRGKINTKSAGSESDVQTKEFMDGVGIFTHIFRFCSAVGSYSWARFQKLARVDFQLLSLAGIPQYRGSA